MGSAAEAVVRRKLLIWCLLAATSSLALAVPSLASAMETKVLPPRIERVPWQPNTGPKGTPVEGEHAFNLNLASGYCVGREPEPEFDHVKIVERPKTKQRPFKSAVITTFQRRPEFTAVIPPPNTEPEHVVYGVCFGVGLQIPKRIRLKRPLDHLFLYDGFYSPLRRVWPELGR